MRAFKFVTLLSLYSLVVRPTGISWHWQLHMLGYDMSWAAFNVIEVMSSESFFAKRIGYLAASHGVEFLCLEGEGVGVAAR